MKPEIIIIGAAIIDVLVRPVSEEVFHTGSYPAEDISMSVGADALNEATILSRMGKRVRLETVIGKDKAGKYIIDHCKENGIEVEDSCIQEDLTTGINVVLVKEDGTRNFLTNPGGSLRSLRLEDIKFPFPESAGLICFASIFVFPHIGVKELEEIFFQAKMQNKIVCADMTKRKKNETVSELAPALKYIDYLLPNDEEAMLFTEKDSVEEAAEALVDAGVKNVIIKCGSHGCLVRNQEECFRLPAQPGVNCIDTTGAGDSFAAGFLYALSEGKSLRECAEYGNLCGARAVSVVGATEWI